MPRYHAGMKTFEKLLAWRACHKLVLTVYQVTTNWPSDEKFGLTAQVRRAAVSVASNIAEGSARRGYRELRRFLDLSLGSLSELQYLTRLAQDLEILGKDGAAKLEAQREEAGRLTWGLYSYASKRC
jgi:four helix bundle protein